jgi:hypothetical protein
MTTAMITNEMMRGRLIRTGEAMVLRGGAMCLRASRGSGTGLRELQASGFTGRIRSNQIFP